MRVLTGPHCHLRSWGKGVMLVDTVVQEELELVLVLVVGLYFEFLRGFHSNRKEDGFTRIMIIIHIEITCT